MSIVHQQGQLTEPKMSEYAQARKMDEVVVGLSLLCGLPVNVTERALLDETGDLLLVLTRAIGYSWSTSMAFLFLAAPDHRISAQDLEKKKQEYERLSSKAAQKILEFYKSRKNSLAMDDSSHRPQRLGTH